MRKSEKKNHGVSLSFLILKNYTVFFMLVLLLAFVLIFTFQYLEVNVWWDTPEKITEQKNLLKNERYDDIPVMKYLGKNGYIEVLDENAHVLYSGKKGPVASYSKNVLEYIPDIESNTFYSINYLKDEDGVYNTVVERTTVGDNNFYLEEIMILDPDGNVLFNTNDSSEETVTEQELNYISGEAGDRTTVQKYQFETKKGQTRYLLIHTVDHTLEYNNILSKTALLFLVVFMAGLFISILIAVASISHTVLRPLNLMKSAMENLAHEREKYGSIEKINYNGPRELTAICDSFNDMADDLRSSEDRRKKLEQDRQKMLADISHDIKTPVTVIEGYAQALESGLVPESEVPRYLREIQKKSEILSELVNSFYEFSRLDHPGFSLDKSKADLAEFLRAYLAEKYEELELSGFDVDIDIPENVVTAEFDSFQLKRVFENIISNALKHNKSGCTIIASLQVCNKGFTLTIGDNGSGIPEELRDKIFDPFVVGEAARVSGRGSGLGLSIAQKIVEAHGWHIGLKKDVPGTVFEIHGTLL
ncbi:Signal transduction histidine kinase [Lachnospiraceae bacterium]|nr:Signal transduction histidine kinase [Lachnospiraceae bacterium]